MKQIRFLRRAALLPAFLLLSCSNAALCCAAEESIAEEESIAAEESAAAEDQETTEASDTDEAAGSSAESGEEGTYTSGDYTYTVIVNTDDESERAVCIQSYAGTETELVLPAEIDGMDVVALGDHAFQGSERLETIMLPETLTIIGKYSFVECSSLREFAVDTKNPAFSTQNGVLYADEGTALVRWPLASMPAEVTVPEGVDTIGNVAFACSTELTAVNLPGTLERIGMAAFSECEKLTEVTFPEGLKEISDFAFNSCKNLKTVKFPSTLTSIGSGAFSATALAEIELPENLTFIGEQAFAATNLTEVTIPAGVQEIGYSAFGWDRSQSGELIVNRDFLIRGYAQSSAYAYAADSEAGNHFRFELISDQPVTSEAAATDEKSGVSGLVRVIGIAVCGTLMLLVIAVTVLSGRSKNAKAAAEEDPETAPESAPAVTPDEAEAPEKEEDADDA